jgi:hypothetical protein
MDAEVRLDQAARYLRRTAAEALRELAQEGLEPLTPETEPAHASVAGAERRARFQGELEELLGKERKEGLDGSGLRRVAELTELLQGEPDARIWWERAAAQGDVIAAQLLADD